MYGGFIISYGGSFESSQHSGVDFGARIHYRESFIMSKLVKMCCMIALFEEINYFEGSKQGEEKGKR